MIDVHTEGLLFEDGDWRLYDVGENGHHLYRAYHFHITDSVEAWHPPFTIVPVCGTCKEPWPDEIQGFITLLEWKDKDND